MTAYTPIVRDDAALPDFKPHYARANEWRGRCIAHFSKAEYTIAEMLAYLSQRQANTIKLPRLHGQRLSTLSSAIERESMLGKAGSSAIAALAVMADLQGLRNFLCHGRSTILLTEKGQCYCLLEMIGHDGEKQTMAITPAEMDAKEIVVIKGKGTLCSELGKIRKALTSPTS